jgi:outer membrane immunogenic protein
MGDAMRRAFFVAAFAGCLVGAAPLAYAADMGPAPMPAKGPMAPQIVASTWTGCYLGGNIGGGWAHKDFTDSFSGFNDGSHTASGIAGGGQIGCDYQFATSWVIGIQGMWDAASLTGDNVITGDPHDTVHSKVRSFGTVTGRVGYLLMPQLLFYGKGGFAWADDRFNCNGDVSGGCYPGWSASGTRSGWDAGVGLSWMVAPNWDLWIEYDHLGLGTKTVTFTPDNGIGHPFNEDIKQSVDKVLVGFDYRFSFGQ